MKPISCLISNESAQRESKSGQGPKGMTQLSNDGTRWHRVPHFVPIVAAALIGLALSISACYVVSLRQNRVAELELGTRANSHELLLESGINHYTDKIVALQDLFESSDHEVTRGEFTDFAKFLLRDQNAILSITWVPRIRRGERIAHELAAVRDGLPGYRITSVGPDGTLARSADLDEYFPIYYSAHAISGDPVYGLNLNDGGFRQQTLERARDDDHMATSPNISLPASLLQVAGDRNGFFVVLPVYRPGLPHQTVADRRSNLIGFVQGVFRTSVMLETILAASTTPAGLDLYFFATNSPPDAPPLYFHSSRARTVPIEAKPRTAVMAGQHWSGELSAGDARWTFLAVPIPGGPGTAGHQVARIVLIFGVLVSGLVVAYIWASDRSAGRLRAAYKQLDQAHGALNFSNEQLKLSNQQLLEHNMRFDTALNNMSQGLLMFDSAERIVVCNDRYIEMYGLSHEIVKPGCSLRQLLHHRAEIGYLTRDPEEYRAGILSGLAQGKTTTVIIKTADAREMLITNSGMARGGWVVTHEDITERRRAEAKISHMAMHDALTNLPNRLLFREQIENRLTQFDRDQKFAVLCLDLDDFKNVNDTLGHQIGDQLLRQVGERLRSCLREGDGVARLSGDEFAILQGSITQPTDTTSLMTRILEAISAPFDLEGNQVVVGVSIGVAVAPTDAADSDQLLKSADMALYRAKADGRGTYRFFEPEMDARMQARRAMEVDLRRALVKGEFEVYYQPLMNIKTELICGFEALIRWNHPERGIMSPIDFIPLAEETALIVPIGEWVLRQACAEAKKWPRDISVAVNISPAQFKTPGLYQIVFDALAHSGLAANRVELEITESVLLVNNKSTVDTLHRLRALGARISMDDFGTGYSSLSYLRSFPFNKIKIDQSFVHDLSINKDSMAIIRAVVGLGNSLGMVTTGEGVETQEELEYLKREGCTEAQGYLFGKARPARDVVPLLANQAVKIRAVA
jgi:diguanylate cyclase (GGDEF)-like protein